jgi:hypothetical protein
MGAAAGAGASGSSIGSAALGAYSAITKGQATQAADEAQAARAERAAEFGKMQAGLTDTVMREQLNTTLSNIDVIRAAAHTDPTSNTGVAVEAYQSKISDRQRTAALANINQQVAQDTADADYLRKAGQYALNQGYIGAGIQVASAVAQGFLGGAGGGGGGFRGVGLAPGVATGGLY